MSMPSRVERVMVFEQILKMFYIITTQTGVAYSRVGKSGDLDLHSILLLLFYERAAKKVLQALYNISCASTILNKVKYKQSNK